jgi:hypothetical protein
MLFSDFAASGGVLDVALVDPASPTNMSLESSSPDCPQPPPPAKLAITPLNIMPSAAGPDFPQPPPNKLTTPPFAMMPSAMGPDLPQPPPNK